VTPTGNDRETRFTILLSELNNGDPISDAQVNFRAVLSGTEGSALAPVTLTVPPERGQPGFYDATLTLPRYGDWQVSVQVQRGSATGAATFVLPLQAPPDLTSPVWLFALLPILIGVGAAVFLYFWRVPGHVPGAPPTSTGSGETTNT
jgi:YtkA-like protein